MSNYSDSTDFIRRTCREYAAWCATFYVPESLDERGMKTLDGLWAWQEQERRIDALKAQIAAVQATESEKS